MAATERRTDRITIKYKKDNKKKMKAKVHQDKLLTMEFRYTVCDTGVFGIVQFQMHYMHARTHTHTQPFNGPFYGTTWVSWYQRGQTNLDFTEATDSEW